MSETRTPAENEIVEAWMGNINACGSADERDLAEIKRGIAKIKAETIAEAIAFVATEPCGAKAPGSGDPCFAVKGHDQAHRGSSAADIYRPEDFTLEAFIRKIKDGDDRE